VVASQQRHTDHYTMRTLGLSLLALTLVLVATPRPAISQPSVLPIAHVQTTASGVEDVGYRFRGGYVGYRFSDGSRRCFYRPYYRVYYAPYWVHGRPYYYWPYYPPRPPHAWGWC
jgi:hypothetical protein